MKPRSIATLVALALATCACGGTVTDGTGVLTLAEYFRMGEARVVDALATSESDPTPSRICSRAVVDEAGRSVVRVRIHFGRHGGSYSTTSATGVLLQGGAFVATVAHEAVVATQHDDARVEVVLPDGRSIGARAPSLAHYDPTRAATDWALLELEHPPAGLPSVPIGAWIPGPVAVLGYPGRFGVTESGAIDVDDVASTSPLRALRLLCRAGADDTDSLELVAGAVPIGGFSGSPCVDAQGRLIGIQRGVTETRTNGRLSWSLDVVPIDALRADLSARGSNTK